MLIKENTLRKMIRTALLESPPAKKRILPKKRNDSESVTPTVNKDSEEKTTSAKDTENSSSGSPSNFSPKRKSVLDRIKERQKAQEELEKEEADAKVAEEKYFKLENSYQSEVIRDVIAVFFRQPVSKFNDSGYKNFPEPAVLKPHDSGYYGLKFYAAEKALTRIKIRQFFEKVEEAKEGLEKALKGDKLPNGKPKALARIKIRQFEEAVGINSDFAHLFKVAFVLYKIKNLSSGELEKLNESGPFSNRAMLEKFENQASIVFEKSGSEAEDPMKAFENRLKLYTKITDKIESLQNDSSFTKFFKHMVDGEIGERYIKNSLGYEY